jgi:uncharacterized protein (DUF1778 family)
MSRAVVPVRLSDAEREQIARAAARLELSLSGFIRQAALQASAVVEERVSVTAPKREAPERELGLVVLDDARPTGHYVDGELVGSLETRSLP